MRAAAILGLVIALGVGYFVYDGSLTQGTVAQAPPQQQIDEVSIRTQLQTIGQAERQYLVAHSTYGTLEQLQQDNLVLGALNQRGYTLSATVDGSRGFTVTATPTDPDRAGWPTLAIDETMVISSR
jgi:hypothetical protein